MNRLSLSRHFRVFPRPSLAPQGKHSRASRLVSAFRHRHCHPGPASPAPSSAAAHFRHAFSVLLLLHASAAFERAAQALGHSASLPPTPTLGGRRRRRRREPLHDATMWLCPSLRWACASRRWACSLSLREKALPHVPHTNGLSPVWTRQCRLHLVLSRKSLPQNGQWYTVPQRARPFLPAPPYKEPNTPVNIVSRTPRHTRATQEDTAK